MTATASGDASPPAVAARFRLAGRDDLEVVLGMMRQYYEEDGYPWRAAAAGAALTELLDEPARGRVWVIVVAGELVGYVVLTLGFSLEYLGRDAFVDELYVASDHRGRGLGAQALAVLEAAARSLGVRALHLEAERAKPDLYRFYRRAGFADHDRQLLTKWLVEPDDLEAGERR